MKRQHQFAMFALLACLAGCSDGTTVYHEQDPDNPGDPEQKECKDVCKANKKTCIDDTTAAVCKKSDAGCLAYKSIECPNGYSCEDGTCVDENGETPCEDECQAGSKSCTEDGKSMVCDDFNDDGCLENQIAPCNDGETCQNGICQNGDNPLDPCTDECPEDGRTECEGTTGVKTCGNYDDDSCLEWSEVTECKDSTTCSDGNCNCTNECDANGDAQCEENGVKICADTNGDGCLEWSSVTPCNEMTCKDGACVCEHQCDANAKECSGEGFRTCTTNAQACRVWSEVTACKAGCENGICKPEVIMEPTRYPGNRILSPVTAYSVQRMKDIAAKQSRSDVHFAKIGDSHFAPGTSAVFMYCFASNKSHNLNGADFLENSITAFQSKSPNSFSRDSVSSVIGKTAWWAVKDGKLAEELSVMNPRFAFFDYGSNDIGWYDYLRPEGSSSEGYFGTLQWFYREYRKGLDIMLNSGVIPLLLGTGVQSVKTYKGRTLGYNNPFYYVPVFDAVARGLAEQYQIPYLNLAYMQMQEPLKSNNYGLSSDNLHHSQYNGGCDFTDKGMQYGHNARNRYSIEMLDRAYRTVVQGEDAPDTPIPFKGKGSKDSPYEITDLPYTHPGNSSKGTNNFSTYSCSSKSEAGPEIYYKLTVTQSTKIRAFSVSASGVDVDIHLLSAMDANSCMARGDKWVESNLAAGTYYFSVDTSSSASNAGEYLFGIVECLPDDGLCGAKTTGG